MRNINISIWKDKIILRNVPTFSEEPILCEPKERPDYWPDAISPFCTYNEKLQGYLLSFSAQNLRRLHSVFGPIYVNHGQQAIEGLKSRFAEWKKEVEILSSVVTGELDEFKINYKKPPLALYQHRGVVGLSLRKRFALFADCGLGKTFQVLNACQYHIENNIIPPGKTLISGKLATLFSGWVSDCKKFTDLKAEVLWQSSTYKKKAKILAKLDSDADIFIINHEGLNVYKDALREVGFKKVVIDESTVLKSFTGLFSRQGGGVIGKAAMEVAHNADWRVIMTGTPASNGAYELWGQMHFIDPEGFLLEGSFWDFRKAYMEEVFFGKVDKTTGKPADPNTPSTWRMRANSDRKISELIKPHCYRVKIRDHLKDLPEKTIIPMPIVMSDEQIDLYLTMRKEVLAVLGGDTISVKNQLTQIIKLRQITGGFLLTDQQNYIEISDNPKMVMLDNLIEEIGIEENKIIIFAQYQWEIKSIEDRYKTMGAVSVYGGNTSKHNLENIDSFIHNDPCRLIVLHPKSAAHGITLTMAHYMIFYSVSYSAEEDYQCIKRIERAGQKHPMFIYYLLAKGQDGKKAEFTMSIDEIIYAAVQSKLEKQEKLLASDYDENTIEDEIITQWRSYG